jgi:hypothetical protein
MEVIGFVPWEEMAKWRKQFYWAAGLLAAMAGLALMSISNAGGL